MAEIFSYVLIMILKFACKHHFFINNDSLINFLVLFVPFLCVSLIKQETKFNGSYLTLHNNGSRRQWPGGRVGLRSERSGLILTSPMYCP